jgi:endoglucanase
MRISLCFWLLALPLFGDVEPAGVAAEARLFLTVPPQEPPLREVSCSRGTVSSPDWEGDPVKRVRMSDVRFPVNWWRWSDVMVRFVPSANGTVELSLNGPCSETRPGVLSRQEIYWDRLSAEGAVLKNGGFEEMGKDGVPLGWQSPWHAYPAAGEWPLEHAVALEGSHCAASWQNRPLVQRFEVRAGVPVVLHFSARAAQVPGFVEPRRLGQDTPASRAAATFHKGVNIGNNWEAPPDGGWRVKHDIGDLDRIAREGFDHIRVPVAWHFRMREKGGRLTVDPAFFAELDPFLRHALDLHLRVILNWHHFNEFCKDPSGQRDKFVRGWDVIARHYASWPPELMFELLNEPCDALDTATVSSCYVPAIAAIRRSNPARILLASPGRWSSIGELDTLRLPDNDDRIIVTVHTYEPFYFSHQQAGWAGLQALRGIVYPGPPPAPVALPDAMKDNHGLAGWLEGYNNRPTPDNPCSRRVIEETLDQAAAWSQAFGRPVHLGEFGSHAVADPESRSRHAHDIRVAAEARHIPWTLWDWKAGFRYWDEASQKPLMWDALFGNN